MANKSIIDWEFSPLIDFGIKLLNTIPSKDLSLIHLPAEEMHNLRITYEEWNLSISPLQIVRGLAVLYILADGKCKIKLSNLISKALFGIIEPLGKNIHEVLNDLCIYYLKSNGTIQIYFEENHLLTFDDDLIEYIEKYYGTRSRGMEMVTFDLEEKTGKGIVQTMCFQANSNEQTIINEMNKNVKVATCGSIKYVIRHDLSPKQQTRLALVTSFDSTFYWKPPGQITEVEISFYETYKKISSTRSVTKAYRCDGFFRTCLTKNNIRIVELDSEIENFKMYLFQPKKLFSSDFLKSLNSKQLQYYINQINLKPERKSVIIPCFSINSPVGLRSVFASCKPFCHFICKKKHPQFPYPCIARIFSPDKAEFGMIYGKAAEEFYGPSHIYPLWDYYHKTKMALKIGQPELMNENESEVPVLTYEGPTMKDDSIERKQQQMVAVTGRMMIIEGQTETDRKHYMIGILGNEKGDDFVCKQILNSLSESKKRTIDKRKSLKNYSQRSRSSTISISNTMKSKGRNDFVDRRIVQRKNSPSRSFKKSIHKNIIRKKNLPQQKYSKRKPSSIKAISAHEAIANLTEGSSTKSSTGKSSKTIRQVVNNDKNDDRKDDNYDNKTQASMSSSKHSLRFGAGGEIKMQNLESVTAQISNEKTIGDLKEATSQKKQSMLHLMKKPEIALADKRDIIMVEQDEATSGTNAYFMPRENQVKNIKADIIFDTPFLYMIVSKSQMGRLLIVSIGRFTNIQETNPPENMQDIDVSIITTDDNDNRYMNDNINRNVYPNISK